MVVLLGKLGNGILAMAGGLRWGSGEAPWNPQSTQVDSMCGGFAWDSAKWAPREGGCIRWGSGEAPWDPNRFQLHASGSNIVEDFWATRRARINKKWSQLELCGADELIYIYIYIVLIYMYIYKYKSYQMTIIYCNLWGLWRS